MQNVHFKTETPNAQISSFTRGVVHNRKNELCIWCGSQEVWFKTETPKDC